jgi:ADP-heptose:LPS heptosyltransferase
LGILKFLLFEKWGYTKREFKNIVVYTVGIVGDNVVMLPALAALRRRYPAAKITVITNCQIWNREGAIGVLEPSPYKDRLIVLNEDPVQRRGLRLWMDGTKFGEIRCDLFVNLSPFGNRGWVGAVVREMFFARMLGAKYAVGFRMSTFTRKDLFCKVQYRFLKNEPRRSQEILKELGLTPAENEDLLAHDSFAKESVIKKIGEKGGDNLPLFVINPGAKFESKCWPTERFGEIAKYFVKHYDASVVITGNKEEEHIADEVIKQSGGVAISLAGRTSIQELTELLRIAKGCITNDTGTMHIAAMVGVPTVALFSSRLSPTHWLPAGHNVVSIFSLLDCIYCYKDSCKTLDCMKRINVIDVVSAFNQVTKICPSLR